MPLYVLAIIGPVVVVTLVLFRAWGPRLIINQTPSEPMGIYRLVSHPLTDYQRGMYVIFPVPREVRTFVYGRGWLREGIPFLKELLGLPGDRVCISNTDLRINAHTIGPVFEHDGHGLPLPRRRGCFIIPEGQFFAASGALPNSFDGRYFGALPLTELTGEARPVWTF